MKKKRILLNLGFVASLGAVALGFALFIPSPSEQKSLTSPDLVCPDEPGEIVEYNDSGPLAPAPGLSSPSNDDDDTERVPCVDAPATGETRGDPTGGLAEGTYRARNGDPQRGEQAARVYVERNVSLAQLGDYDPDGDGWALVGRTNGDGDNGLLANFWMELTTPLVSIRHPQKDCLTLKPVSREKVVKGQTRLLREYYRGSPTCRPEPRDADLDSDGVGDSFQRLYRARNGNTSRNEIAARVYIERNRNASEARGGYSDYDPDGDGWALVGRTNGAGDDGVVVGLTIDELTFDVTVRVQHPTRGCLSIGPVSTEFVSRGQTRLAVTRSESPGSC